MAWMIATRENMSSPTAIEPRYAVVGLVIARDKSRRYRRAMTDVAELMKRLRCRQSFVAARVDSRSRFADQAHLLVISDISGHVSAGARYHPCR